MSSRDVCWCSELSAMHAPGQIDSDFIRPRMYSLSEANTGAKHPEQHEHVFRCRDADLDVDSTTDVWCATQEHMQVWGARHVTCIPGQIDHDSNAAARYSMPVPVAARSRFGTPRCVECAGEADEDSDSTTPCSACQY